MPSQSTLTWIVILLLVLIIVLLSLCLYFDIRVITAPTFSTTKAPVSSAPPLTTVTPDTEAKPPVTTARPPVTQAKPPVTTKVPVTTKAPVTQAPPVTTKPSTPVTTPTPDPDAPTVCIDPGHGFGDPGALGTLNGKTYYESEINLEIAMKLKDALLSLGYNVIMTHDGKTLPADKYLSESSPIYNVNNRCQFIKDNKSKIDLVVSVHCNTFPSNTSVKGSRYYILPYGYTGFNAKSETLAASLVDAVFASFSLAEKPGQYTQNLGVLKSGIPSVLVECGFMTNSSDLTNLVSQWWQTKYVTALANGVDAYCKANLK